MDADRVARIVCTVLCLIGIVACWRIRNTNFRELSAQKRLYFGVFLLSTMAALKAFAFFSLVLIPASTVLVANYQMMEVMHKVDGCASCHVMLPMVHDMQDPGSDTLAARHFKNRWIPQNQCYQCHSDYGLAGDMEAKMTGFRHLARYTTRSYIEPIVGRTPFKNRNCLKCHESSPRFAAVTSHKAVFDLLKSSAMSCTNCHGVPHPTRLARSPGSEDYPRLMKGAR